MESHTQLPKGHDDRQASLWHVSEILVAPARRGDGPWIELTHQGTAITCFEGLIEIASEHSIIRRAPFSGCAGPKEHLVVGDIAQAEGIAAVRPGSWGPLPLPSGRLVLRSAGRALTEVAWGPNTPIGVVRRGHASARVAARPDAPWCTVWGERYDGFNTGTPGASFDGCATCRDPQTAQLRPSDPIPPGSLIVEEVWARTPPPRRNNQSITLRNVGNTDLDLTDLELIMEPVMGLSRSWWLLGLGCMVLRPQEACRIGMGHVYGPDESFAYVPGFFSGALVPLGDSILTLRQRSVILFRGIVPRCSRGPSKPVSLLSP